MTLLSHESFQQFTSGWSWDPKTASFLNCCPSFMSVISLFTFLLLPCWIFFFPSPLLASVSTWLKIQQYPLALFWPSFISTFLLDYFIIPWVSMPSTCWRLSSLFLQPKLSSKLHLHTCLLDVPTGCLLRISNFKKLSKSEVLISTQTCPLLVFPILVNNTSGAQLSKLKT